MAVTAREQGLPVAPGRVPAGTVSVVVPTRNEAGNVRPLVSRLASALGDRLEEIIFVDDSDDATAGVVADVAGSDDRIALIHRPPGDRAGGLSGAVIAGLGIARGDWICVMDGDLQHPPETIPEMIDKARLDELDLVSAGRFAPGSETEMSSSRQALSRFLIGTVHRSFVSLRSLRDPLTGFFVLRRGVIDLESLRPLGFKILVEIVARHPEMAVGEVGFDFYKRHEGHSKASPRVMWDFIRHVFRLRRQVGGGKRHHYDIHGIITVSSPVRLPELKRFEVDRLGRAPTISICVGATASGEGDDLAYREIGGAGFGMRMRRSPRMVISVSRLLALSPHVLYTNVVEPVLRWEFVRRGFALVHAACIAGAGSAFLITARTDTGKTTTMLKLLDRSDLGFVSDDLLLIDRTGLVLTYPKPLTISSHTVAAVRRAELRRFERAALTVQSRLHSRSGRKFAFALTKSRLPVATINAIAQLVIPPPKYDVTRLVPGVEVVEKARIAGLYIIERGAPGERALDEETALDILLENCEDAYGFPPYAEIEQYLHSSGGEALRDEERKIIAEALAGCPAKQLSSDRLGWAESIARDLGTDGDEGPISR